MRLRGSHLPMSYEVYCVIQLMSLACRRLLRFRRWGLLIIPPFWGRKEPCSFGPVLVTPKLLSRLDHFPCGSGPGLARTGCFGVYNVGECDIAAWRKLQAAVKVHAVGRSMASSPCVWCGQIAMEL